MLNFPFSISNISFSLDSYFSELYTNLKNSYLHLWKLLTSFYYRKNWIIFYLFFTDLYLFTRILPLKFNLADGRLNYSSY